MPAERDASLRHNINDDSAIVSSLTDVSSMKTSYYQINSRYDSHYDCSVKERLTSTSPARMSACGVATTKPLLSWLDVLVATVSISCCALATTVVRHNYLAWWLGVTYQLVLVGFLLSIMNLCLIYIAPTFFLLCEARYGTSTLQNYDAVLRSTPFASNIGWAWRAVLLLLTLLPLGLSAGYKLFVGGTSTHTIGPDNTLYSDEYGLNAAPGLLPSLQTVGTSLMLNVSLPFMLATTTNISALADNGTFGDPALDPPIPRFPQAYGFNMLVLSEKSVAMLDVPAPTWLNKVQAVLESGEYWNITATVTATVSIYNDTVDQHRNLTRADDVFWNYYGTQAEYSKSDSGFASTVLYNGWNVGIMSSHWGPDESWCFVGIYPDPGGDFASFAPHARMYDTIRTPCEGTWTVTQGAIELIDGLCDLTPAARPASFERDQTVLRNNSLTLGNFYLPTLMEYLGPFATLRNESRWLTATVSAVVASMKWSKITSLDSPTRQDFATRGGGKYIDAGLLYNTTPTIVSARATLRRSWGLFVMFAVQPLLTLAMMMASVALHEVPIGKGFGMVAVLASVDPRTLGTLRGSGFSGKVAGQVRLNVHVVEHGNRSAEIVYTLGEEDSVGTGVLRRRWRYS